MRTIEHKFQSTHERINISSNLHTCVELWRGDELVVSMHHAYMHAESMYHISAHVCNANVVVVCVVCACVCLIMLTVHRISTKCGWMHEVINYHVQAGLMRTHVSEYA